MDHFFPHLPLHIGPIALFGLTLLCGLISGEIAGRIRFLPRVIGYIALGLLVGPTGLNLLNKSIIANFNYFVDISLGLILFELGRHLDFTWLRHDKGLLRMSLSESSLTFIFLFSLFYFFIKLPALESAFAATIGLATSPALVMMVAHDISAKGPVTRRALILTSLNNIFSLTIFTILLPMPQAESHPDYVLWLYIGYRFFGSIIAGLIIFFIARTIALFIGKQRENQFVLYVSTVVLTIGVAHTLHISTMLTLFVFGAAARNLDKNHALLEMDFGWLARVFIILLFVVTGVYLKLNGLWYATAAVFMFFIVRMLTKISGIYLFAYSSNLTRNQAFTLSLTLLPMAEIAIGMSNRIVDFNPEFGRQMITIISTAATMFILIGSTLTQYAFIKSGETISDIK